MISIRILSRAIGITLTAGLAVSAASCRQNEVKYSPKSLASSQMSGPFSIDQISDAVMNTSFSRHFSLPALNLIFNVKNAVYPIEFRADTNQGHVWINDVSEADSPENTPPTSFELGYDPSDTNGSTYDPGVGEHVISIEATDASGQKATAKFKVKVMLSEVSTSFGSSGRTLSIKTGVPQNLTFQVASKLSPACVDLATGDVYRQKTPTMRKLAFNSARQDNGSYIHVSPPLEEPVLDSEHATIKTIIYAHRMYYEQDNADLGGDLTKLSADQLSELKKQALRGQNDYLVAKSCKPDQKDYSCYAPILTTPKSPGLLYCGSYGDYPNTPSETGDAALDALFGLGSEGEPQTPEEVLKFGLCGGDLGRFLAKELNIAEKFAFCN